MACTTGSDEASAQSSSAVSAMDLTVAQSIATSAWTRLDGPVQSGAARRSWTWGPTIQKARYEDYDEAGGPRAVVYYDKARMELLPSKPPTLGNLVDELVRGEKQVGDGRFLPMRPVRIPVAGDPTANDSPTYADFTNISFPRRRDVNKVGEQVIAWLNSPGTTPVAVKIVRFENETGHNIADRFETFMNAVGPVKQGGALTNEKLYAPNPVAVFGYPISEPYWVKATVQGQSKAVLVQLFQRRTLTFTPTNAEEFQVEMGNVGLHYLNAFAAVSAKKKKGESCGQKDECESNGCESGRCVGLTIGATCARNEECDSDKCENGKCVARQPCEGKPTRADLPDFNFDSAPSAYGALITCVGGEQNPQADACAGSGICARAWKGQPLGTHANYYVGDVLASNFVGSISSCPYCVVDRDGKEDIKTAYQVKGKDATGRCYLAPPGAASCP